MLVGLTGASVVTQAKEATKEVQGVPEAKWIPTNTQQIRSEYAQYSTNTHNAQRIRNEYANTTNTHKYAPNTHIRTNTQIDTNEYATNTHEYADGYARIRTNTHKYKQVHTVNTHKYTQNTQDTHGGICV